MNISDLREQMFKMSIEMTVGNSVERMIFFNHLLEWVNKEEEKELRKSRTELDTSNEDCRANEK